MSSVVRVWFDWQEPAENQVLLLLLLLKRIGKEKCKLQLRRENCRCGSEVVMSEVGNNNGDSIAPSLISSEMVVRAQGAFLRLAPGLVMMGGRDEERYVERVELA